ncbi:MAG: type II toxin-antitoxin system PemK/MazF family toxin [Roseiflexaceae bacterium]|nr:type II toxin-antitoxin system PemK/MazF family toxin [Roseiflexaceae bacterium]
MGAFVKGDIVVAYFPFSDLSDAKKRPALVLASLRGNDVILCQITSQTVRDSDAIVLDQADFIDGGLRQTSNIRPNRLFTAEDSIILYRAGAIRIQKLAEVQQQLIAILTQ